MLCNYTEPITWISSRRFVRKLQKRSERGLPSPLVLAWVSARLFELSTSCGTLETAQGRVRPRACCGCVPGFAQPARLGSKIEAAHRCRRPNNTQKYAARKATSEQ